MEFFYVHSMNRIEFTNRVFTILRAPITSTAPSSSSLSFPLQAIIPPEKVPPALPPSLPIAVPSNFSHEVKTMATTPLTASLSPPVVKLQRERSSGGSQSRSPPPHATLSSYSPSPTDRVLLKEEPSHPFL